MDSVTKSYENKKVLITGNTGFKGSWLTLWLYYLGAEVHGYSLAPPTSPSLFETLQLEQLVFQEHADVRDFNRLKKTIETIKPDIIFHLAAQSLVGESYVSPLETIQVNTLGTANLLEAVRQTKQEIALIMVTSDKCYQNKEWVHGYRETDPMGGYDPYSASKGAAEILINSWRDSFFHPDQIEKHGVRLASVRAGNVIGGGDWAKDRIVPDSMRDLMRSGMIAVRNPDATRPWQHVLEPLDGYLQLGAQLLKPLKEAKTYCEAFNFGPRVDANKTVQALVNHIIADWGSGNWHQVSTDHAPHEANLLNLSIDKAYHKLHWLPRWDFNTAIKETVAWYKQWRDDPSRLFDFTLGQIKAYEEAGNATSTSYEMQSQPLLK